jgi:hypothetical protein
MCDHVFADEEKFWDDAPYAMLRREHARFILGTRVAA